MGAASTGRREPTHPVIARRSARLCGFMGWWFEGYFSRNMNALRLARWGRPDPPADRPLVVYANHPAWWDAVVYALLARKLMAGRQHFAPIDAAMLDKYRIFARLGCFGIEPSGRKGAAEFLRAAEAILADPARVLFVTAEGRFTDPRVRPLALRAGVGHLARRRPEAVFLPLALDYAFWEERGGEAFAAFGAPLLGTELAALGRDRRQALLSDALAGVMDRLAGDVAARDPRAFLPLVAGKAGIGGVYDLWRRTVAGARGRPFDASHAGAQSNPAAGLEERFKP